MFVSPLVMCMVCLCLGFVGFVSYVPNGRCSVTATWMSVVT